MIAKAVFHTTGRRVRKLPIYIENIAGARSRRTGRDGRVGEGFDHADSTPRGARHAGPERRRCVTVASGLVRATAGANLLGLEMAVDSMPPLPIIGLRLLIA